MSEDRPLLVTIVVRQLHSPRTFTNDYMAPHTIEICGECRQVWPCRTEQVIAEAFAVPPAVPPAARCDASLSTKYGRLHCMLEAGHDGAHRDTGPNIVIGSFTDAEIAAQQRAATT